MKEFQNIYNYDLDDLVTLYINEKGEIVGGSNYKEGYKVGSKFKPLEMNSPELQVLEVKKILVVKVNQ